MASQTAFESSQALPAPLAGRQVRRGDGVLVFELRGALDLATAPALKWALANAFARGVRGVVLELSQVTFMDSTALAVLIGVQRGLRDPQRLALASASPAVRSVLALTRLDAAFRIHGDVGAALGDLQSGSPPPPTPPRPPPLARSASVALGIAASAVAFASGEQEEAERWLRILRTHGQAGLILACLGTAEAPRRNRAGHGAAGGPGPADREVVGRVREEAARIAGDRRAREVGTTDVLLAVMGLYGEAFDRALAAHGADRAELLALLELEVPGLVL
jgi:anti-sigma B factor antagonist